MKRAKLLIINFTMDNSDVLLGHQESVATSIKKSLPETVIFSTNFRNKTSQVTRNHYGIHYKSSRFLRGIKFSFLFFWIFLRHRPRNVFFHMNPIYAAICAPIVYIFKIRMILWYTHKSVPCSLRIAQRFVHVILTASIDSLSFKSSKVVALGHHVDQDIFLPTPVRQMAPRFFVLGRVSRSKNLLEIISEIDKLNENLVVSSLDFYGPISDESYFDELQKFIETNFIHFVQFLPPISRLDISNLATNYSIFLHASSGSLDKVILEMTLLQMPVVSSNPIHLRVFGAWNKSGFTSIANEVSALFQMDSESLERELIRRRLIVLSDHSLQSWVSKFLKLLH